MSSDRSGTIGATGVPDPHLAIGRTVDGDARSTVTTRLVYLYRSVYLYL